MHVELQSEIPAIKSVNDRRIGGKEWIAVVRIAGPRRMRNELKHLVGDLLLLFQLL